MLSFTIHRQPRFVLPSGDTATALDLLKSALFAAYAARRGVPPTLRPLAMEYARVSRLAGVEIGAFLVDVKQLVRDTTGTDEPIFMPKVIGWAIAGFFEGTSARKSSDAD